MLMFKASPYNKASSAWIAYHFWPTGCVGRDFPKWDFPVTYLCTWRKESEFCFGKPSFFWALSGIWLRTLWDTQAVHIWTSPAFTSENQCGLCFCRAASVPPSSERHADGGRHLSLQVCGRCPMESAARRQAASLASRTQVTLSCSHGSRNCCLIPGSMRAGTNVHLVHQWHVWP